MYDPETPESRRDDSIDAMAEDIRCEFLPNGVRGELTPRGLLEHQAATDEAVGWVQQMPGAVEALWLIAVRVAEGMHDPTAVKFADSLADDVARTMAWDRHDRDDRVRERDEWRVRDE